MYHNLSTSSSVSKGLTISNEKFEEQIKYLVDKQYTFFFASEIIKKTTFPKKSIALTFDDVTENQLLYAIPVLKKYNAKATFFIPFNYIGKSDLWNEGLDSDPEKIMTIDQLKSIDNSIIEFGHHSFFHKPFTKLSLQEIQEDLDKSYAFINENNLTVFPSIAYPFGKYPKKKTEKEDFFKVLEKNNIQMGFRIGNRRNKLPLENIYEIQRIDIKGEDSLLEFKMKIKIGKLGLF